MVGTSTIPELMQGLYSDLKAWCDSKGVVLRVARDTSHAQTTAS